MADDTGTDRTPDPDPDRYPGDPARLDRVRFTSAALRRDARDLLKALRSELSALRAFKERLTSVPMLLAPVRSNGTPSDGADGWAAHGFTPREIEVARLLAEGRRNTAIASALGISAHTARHHTQRVLAKLGVHSRAEAGARLRG